MGERVWNSVFIVILFSLAFAYFCSKSLTPFYWIEEGSHENIHHLEMQAICNGTDGGNSSRSIAKKMKSNSHCNWFQGTWVFDDSYPLYDSISCPFIRKVFHCIRFGRPDRQYLKYRWQPHGCELPKYVHIHVFFTDVIHFDSFRARLETHQEMTSESHFWGFNFQSNRKRQFSDNLTFRRSVKY